jgi:hypothetical protein
LKGRLVIEFVYRLLKRTLVANGMLRGTTIPKERLIKSILQKMTQRRIVICCTFRSFSNAENDEIQYAFLESLSSVSLTERFELVVTQFGETGVEEALKKFPIKSTIINEVSQRFSLTKVLLNGIEHAKGGSVVWTTVDIKGNQDSSLLASKGILDQLEIPVLESYLRHNENQERFRYV